MSEENEIHYGFCHCGCGKKTRISQENHKTFGYIKGEPRRFIKGHQSKRDSKLRFWEKVDKRGPNDCWEWTGTTQLGYGHINRKGKRIGANRFSWEIHNGPIPDGLFVCHNCPGGDCRACVNPAHLWLGTHGDNMRDMFEKGTNPFGEQSGASVLLESQVKEIRLRYAQGGISHRALAAGYDVSKSAISSVIWRRTWKHIP